MRSVLKRIGFGLGGVVALVLVLAGVVWLRNYPWPVEPERVTFSSGGVELVGVLLEPEGEGPHPVIVKLSGAECGTHGRLVNRIFANHFVPRGFALMVYDKRGCGESGGDHAAAELPDFAADARAAVRLLRGRTDIRGDAIGLMGGSQSGWFTPEVAVEEGAAFIINASAPTERWDRTVLFEIENDKRADGVDEAGLREILDLWPRTWEYYRRAAEDPALASGPEREALEAEIAEARKKDWYEHASIKLADYDSELYAAWSSTIYYDPRPYLERLEVPLLALFGRHDINVPAERSAAVLRELAAADPRREFTVVIFEDLGHQLQSWSAPGRVGFVYLDEMVEFAEAAIGSPAVGSP